MPIAGKENQSEVKCSPNLSRLHQKKKVFVLHLRTFCSQVLIKESIIPKMSGLKTPQKMGDICSRFLGQLSDIWTWLLHKSFQKVSRTKVQSGRKEEEKEKKKQGDLVDGKVKQEDWAKGVLGMWGGPSVWERADSPQGACRPPDERSLRKWFKSMDWSLYLCGFGFNLDSCLPASPLHSKCLVIVHSGDSRPHPGLCQAVLNLVLSDWPKALALEILPGLWAWMTCWGFLFNGDIT